MSKIPNRLIKESITTSEDINKLSAGAEILFYRLMVKVDDYGAYYGNEQIVKSECFPLRSDELKSVQVKKWLDELAAAGLIIRYTAADGRKYLKLTKWEKHQQIRAKKSKFPTYDGICNQMISDDINGNHPQENVPVIQSNTIQIQSESEEVVVTPLDLAMDEFAKFRKAMKKPLTDKARELTLQELENLAPNDEETQILILNQSIQRGWQGVFPLKEQPKKIATPKNSKTFAESIKSFMESETDEKSNHDTRNDPCVPVQ